jgi:hypothetical protein
MKQASPALINFLNEVIGFLDGQLVMADAFLFALKNGTNLGYTNAEITFTFDGQRYLGNDILIDGLKYKCSVGLDVDKQQIDISARPDQTIPGGTEFLQALRNGALDGCEITRTRVFWSNIVGGTLVDGVVLFKGRLGSIDKIGRTSAQLTVNSDLVLLDIDNRATSISRPACTRSTIRGARYRRRRSARTVWSAPVRPHPSSNGRAPAGAFLLLKLVARRVSMVQVENVFEAEKFGPRNLVQEIWPRRFGQEVWRSKIWTDAFESRQQKCTGVDCLKQRNLRTACHWKSLTALMQFKGEHYGKGASRP